ncbi:phosphatase PAP2 family protein [Pseudomonas sp. UL073]|uniref:Phosphatase PAP2 family protein n=1 Tax=Zestomonas insulae TaxID=2809017 RepID=A0ABS2IEX5_9GAMM|nr:phosphatase PAP2 family protein [Pseudomonas insulae]MBM7061644.1 phosphatase PAP2 family protein [Pseudomonas insulae]
MPYPSRPLNPWLHLFPPLLLIVLLLSFEPTRLDFALAELFYTPGVGFIGRHDAFLEDILHDRAKQAVILFGVLAVGGWLLSCCYRPWRHLRRPLGYLVLAMGLSTAIVTPLKALTAVQCPWSLRDFGGAEVYSSLLSARPVTEHPGRCWPGGHASTGFTFFALYFLLRDRRPRLARVALLGALALGSLFSVARMLQGAHFLSHNLWTALFDWLICLGSYRLLLYRPQREEVPAIAAVARRPA